MKRCSKRKPAKGRQPEGKEELQSHAQRPITEDIPIFMHLTTIPPIPLDLNNRTDDFGNMHEEHLVDLTPPAYIEGLTDEVRTGPKQQSAPQTSSSKPCFFPALKTESLVQAVTRPHPDDCDPPRIKTEMTKNDIGKDKRRTGTLPFPFNPKDEYRRLDPIKSASQEKANVEKRWAQWYALKKTHTAPGDFGDIPNPCTSFPYTQAQRLPRHQRCRVDLSAQARAMAEIRPADPVPLRRARTQQAELLHELQGSLNCVMTVYDYREDLQERLDELAQSRHYQTEQILTLEQDINESMAEKGRLDRLLQGRMGS